MSFDNLGLHQAITRAVLDAGYTQPTEVQQRAIGPALQGQDLMVSASTGSGKTASFVLPALQRVLNARADPATRRDRGVEVEARRDRGVEVEARRDPGVGGEAPPDPGGGVGGPPGPRGGGGGGPGAGGGGGRAGAGGGGGGGGPAATAAGCTARACWC